MGKTYRNYPDSWNYTESLRQKRDGVYLDLTDNGRELPDYASELYNTKTAKKLRTKRRRRNNKISFEELYERY